MERSFVSIVSNMESNTLEDDTTVEWSPEEKKDIPPLYGCEIIIENGSYAEVSTKKCPSDAHIIEYVVNEKVCYDLTRGLRTKLFDMYYDKFGPNVIRKIDWGFGTISPRVWGYVVPEKKKRK